MPKEKKRGRGRPPSPEMPIMGQPARIKTYSPSDYLHKLNPDERAWHDKFEREYYYQRGLKDKPLHKTKKLRCSLFKKNREAAQDIVPLLHTQPVDVDEKPWDGQTASPEDALIDYLDDKLKKS